MKRYQKIDYNFAPASYWDEPTDELMRLLRNVKGSARREMIRDYWNDGSIDLLDEELQKTTVSIDLRERLGRISPYFMGGEYLPDYLPGEVEIARVELESVTHDVTSIRARPDLGGGILYRIVDEYTTEFELHPERSDAPFTLGQLIVLLDSASENGVVLGTLRWNIDNGNDPGRYADYSRSTSEYYWELPVHYENEVGDLIAEYRRREEVRG